MAKPFIKWVGGKTQLLPTIDNYLPEGLGTSITKYVEPFLGGGAVLFHLTKKYQFEEIIVNDYNIHLIATYESIKTRPQQLMEELNNIQKEFNNLPNIETKQEYYLSKRKEFNEIIQKPVLSNKVASLFIFLNKTGFNGLYRVNKKGQFNTPFGKYDKINLYDETNINKVNNILQKTTLKTGSYSNIEKIVNNKTLLYVDPPYRPLNKTSIFTSYTNNSFTDFHQEQLAEFLQKVNQKGAKFMLSNSDPKNVDPNDNFFDELYSWANINRVQATRNINSISTKRGKIFELLITNYK